MSFIQFAKTKDAAVIVADLQKRIKDQTTRLELYKVIVDTLKPFEGKAVSKRISTALEKALPGVNVMLRKIGSMIYLELMPAGVSYADRVSFLLCYTDNPGGRYPDAGVYHAQTLLERNGDIPLIPERVKALQEGIQRAPELVERYNTIVEQAKTLREQAEPWGLGYELDIVLANERK